jgi:hypothetical protein
MHAALAWETLQSISTATSSAVQGSTLEGVGGEVVTPWPRQNRRFRTLRSTATREVEMFLLARLWRKPAKAG